MDRLLNLPTMQELKADLEDAKAEAVAMFSYYDSNTDDGIDVEEFIEGHD